SAMASRSVSDCAVQSGPVAADAAVDGSVRCRREQVADRAEVVEDQPLAGARPGGDGACRCVRQPRLTDGPLRGMDEALPGATGPRPSVERGCGVDRMRPVLSVSPA